MANFASAIKEEVTRLARKEIKKEVSAAKRQQSQHRKDIAALKRDITTLQRKLAFLEKQETRRLKRGPVAAAGIAFVPEAKADGRTAPRFQARGLRTHREKIGLSAEDYGKLVGVSGLTIYNWEKEKSKPRKSQIPKIADVRKLGQREAKRRLELLPG